MENYEKLIILYNHIAHCVVFNSISQVIRIQSIIYPKRLRNESVHPDNCTEHRTEEAGDLMMRSDLTLQDVPDGVAGKLRGCKALRRGDERVRAGTHEQPTALQMSALRRPVQRRLPLTVHRTDLNTNGNALSYTSVSHRFEMKKNGVLTLASCFTNSSMTSLWDLSAARCNGVRRL